MLFHVLELQIYLYYKRKIYLKINAFCYVSIKNSWLLGFVLCFQEKQWKGTKRKRNDNSKLHNRTKNVAATVSTCAVLNIASKKLEK